MKLWPIISLGLVIGTGIEGQTPGPPAAPAVSPAPTAPAAPPEAATLPRRSAKDLEELVKPIAIYPDPILALLLPAATSPLDVVMAARRLKAGETADQIQKEPWDDSLKGLTHYPEIVKWMDENLEWTSALGEAVTAQEGEVMAAIQRMRGKAKAAGNLPDTAQQEVSVNGGNIEIQPAQENSISVPTFDSDVVYGDAALDPTTPVVAYGPPEPVGNWLTYDCDWPHYGIWVGQWGYGWRHLRDHGHPWQVGTGRIFSTAGFALSGFGVPRPVTPLRTPIIHRFGSFASTGVRPETPTFTRVTAAQFSGAVENQQIHVRQEPTVNGTRNQAILQPRQAVPETFGGPPQRIVVERGPVERGVVERPAGVPARPVEYQERPIVQQPQRVVVPAQQAPVQRSVQRPAEVTVSRQAPASRGSSQSGSQLNGYGWR